MRFRPAALGLVALLLVAGCTGPEGGISVDVSHDDGTGELNTKAATTAIRAGASPTHGQVSGQVLNDEGVAVPGAYVTILNIDFYRQTDGKGRFNFTNIPKGEQFLRVEKEGYVSLQRSFEVLPGRLVELEVVLMPDDRIPDGYREHYHDYHWAGKQTYLIYDGVVERNRDPTAIDCLVFVGECKAYTTLLVPDPGRIVPPGTAKLTIDVELSPGSPADANDPFSNNGFRIYVYPRVLFNGTSPSAGSNEFLIKKNHELFEFVLDDPDRADSGHAGNTEWFFELYDVTLAKSVGLGAYDTLAPTSLRINITAHKGEVLIDPPHPRYWAEADRIPASASRPGYSWCRELPDDASVIGFGGGCMPRTPNPTFSIYTDAWQDGPGKPPRADCRYGCNTLDPGSIVPPGTTRITFDLVSWWTGWYGGEPIWALTPPDKFVLGYKPASVGRQQATWGDYRWVQPHETFTAPSTTDGYGAQGRRYTIDVKPEEADPYYARHTSWVFMMAVEGHEDAPNWEDMECRDETCGRAYFEMKNIVVINSDRNATEEAGAA